MSLPKLMMRRLPLAIAATTALALAGTAAAQSMVVRSTGPSAAKFPAGSRVKDNDRLTLVAGDKLVLMKNGKTRTLSGPGSFQTSGPVTASQNTSTAVTRMLAKGPTMRSRGGFSRGSDENSISDARAPNLWLLDYREAGTFCVNDASGLLLWRPEMDSDQLLQIKQADHSETVAFVSGANYRKWPVETLPLIFGVDYQLSGAGLSAPVSVRFTAIDAVPDGPDASVEALLAKGCSAQADRLIDAMAE
ncbi:MAG TPA: hypothetical protein VFG34_06830 [Sphingopyxis sp.]|nr:hypothetical protein [Sphingopyxis sp.]